MGDLVRESRAKTEDPIKLAVEEWAEGKEGNIRALIATLPQILWEGHGFQPISLGDVSDTITFGTRQAGSLVARSSLARRSPQCHC